MRSIWEFLLVALVVTMTPGPATALVLRVTARDGRRAAFGIVAGNSCAIGCWAGLSALGISAAIQASELAYDVLRFGGAAVLVLLGVRSLIGHRADVEVAPLRRRAGVRTGLIAGLANPKLAVFFVALFPQFLQPGTSVLPVALAMAAVIVCFDVLWFGALIALVDRAAGIVRPRLRRNLERTTGAVMIGLGARIAVEAR